MFEELAKFVQWCIPLVQLVIVAGAVSVFVNWIRGLGGKQE